MFENTQWTELITVENVAHAAFFASVLGYPLYAILFIIIPQSLGWKKAPEWERDDD